MKISSLHGIVRQPCWKSTKDVPPAPGLIMLPFKNATTKALQATHSPLNASFGRRCSRKPPSAYAGCCGTGSRVFETPRALPDKDLVPCSICQRTVALGDAYLCLKCGRFFCSECTTTSITTCLDCESIK